MAPHALDSHPPDDELDPDEPKTPLWMPILGLSLLLLALVYAVSGTEEPTGDRPAEAPAAAPGEAAEAEGEAEPGAEPAH